MFKEVSCTRIFVYLLLTHDERIFQEESSLKFDSLVSQFPLKMTGNQLLFSIYLLGVYPPLNITIIYWYHMQCVCVLGCKLDLLTLDSDWIIWSSCLDCHQYFQVCFNKNNSRTCLIYASLASEFWVLLHLKIASFF